MLAYMYMHVHFTNDYEKLVGSLRREGERETDRERERKGVGVGEVERGDRFSFGGVDKNAKCCLGRNDEILNIPKDLALG